MELPPALRQAVDRQLEGVPLAELRSAAATLSGRYRAELRDGRHHLDSKAAMLAYLATRLPATYAAVRASLGMAAETVPGFAPQTLLDVGAGPGTAMWAARDCWPELRTATLVEASAPARQTGAVLADGHAIRMEWLAADATSGLPGIAPADLVILSYVLDELPPAAIAPLARRLWSLTAGLLVIIEPGTPAGWSRILTVRSALIEAGAHIAAPCPHALSCPLVAPDWCHFSRRVARSRLHRLAKDADVPWEDEKYIFIAASRLPPLRLAARVLAPPRGSSGRIDLKLCQADGSAAQSLVTRRQPEFRTARRLSWGDAVIDLEQP